MRSKVWKFLEFLIVRFYFFEDRSVSYRALFHLRQQRKDQQEVPQSRIASLL